MNLKVYLAIENMKVKDFAKLADCCPTYISQIIHKKAYAGPKMIRDIEKLTNGKVKLEGREKGHNDRKPA
jgi:DNA-binding transcriptional regulator YdaS (Cro superfamily)